LLGVVALGLAVPVVLQVAVVRAALRVVVVRAVL